MRGAACGLDAGRWVLDAQPILSREGPDEASEYQFDGDRLILTFPSKNRYTLERIAE